MKHTDPNFWQYVAVYVMLGAGTILIVGELVEWGFFGKQLSLGGGLLSIWFGVIALVYLSKSRSIRPPSDDQK